MVFSGFEKPLAAATLKKGKLVFDMSNVYYVPEY